MDRIDRQIIAALQARGRTTNAELARLASLAPSSTLDRVRRLEERGVIRGYRALLAPQALGLDVQAMVLINLDRHQAGPIEEFEERIRAVPGVKACYHLTGRYDYMLHLIARDIDHLRELVTHTIGSVRGVEKQETFLVLSMPKEDVGCPLDVLPSADQTTTQEA
ncbi:MAG: winged helix-turn-helix transcriptional regulator [Candidatus Eisenbacteria bacterium]|nr:winged helix-turn-helix transcriptional regulator [Candidatus Eisenbacteria bacterium]MBD3236541.1 winged helix-turn-helix transcriptional regulator [Candidatus Eisenbacteria bacterium]